jgi:hypothetical protein
MNGRGKIPESSKKVTLIKDRLPVPQQGNGQYGNFIFFLLNSLSTIVDGTVAMRWAIAALIVLFIGVPDLHDAIVSWALTW